MLLQITANEELFNKFKRLGSRLSSLSAIVQNDGEITENQVEEFHILMNMIIVETMKLETSVGLYINKCNPKINDD